MNIYILTGEFINNNKFNFSIEEFPVIQYEANKTIIYENGFITITESTHNLNKFLMGLLNDTNPKISIKTLNKEKLEQYRNEIINLFNKNLQEHKRTIEVQLEILKNLV